jgi:polyhydroxyalkanoate synthesis regulator phasin
LIEFTTELIDFYVEEGQAAQEEAQALASDVQTLMLNRGGPVAAKTMDPILDETHQQVGYEIAIVPSAVSSPTK